MAKKYTVAINDFLADGGDGYNVMKGKTVVGEIGTYEEVFAAYLNSNGTKGCEVSGRIVEAPVPVTTPEPVPQPIPEPAPEPTPSPAPVEEVKEEIYIVVSGDVLWRIAQKYNTTWQVLAEYNKLSNPHLIFVNQKIRIPVK